MKLHDLDSSERLKGVDTTRHFSYHAFEAETGERQGAGSASAPLAT
jgi:hypothetical protein